jgi:hypothetical protein
MEDSGNSNDSSGVDLEFNLETTNPNQPYRFVVPTYPLSTTDDFTSTPPPTLIPGTLIYIKKVVPEGPEDGVKWVPYVFIGTAQSYDVHAGDSDHPICCPYTCWMVYNYETGIVEPINPLLETISLYFPVEVSKI